MSNGNELVKHDLQMMPIAEAKEWYSKFVEFSQSILKKDMDYGIIPGTPKPCLYKAGAEKLRFVYGLGVEFEVIDKTTTLDPMFVDYTYKCSIRSKTGQILAQCEGSCNSMEEKYRWSWITRKVNPSGDDEDSKVLVEQRLAKWYYKDTKKGKVWYFSDKIANPDIVGKKNTIMKMAQKRAFVGAMLLATGASEFFSQDLDNLDPHEEGKKEPDSIEDPTKPAIDPYLEWREALKALKTKEEVDVMAAQNKEMIEKNKDLRKVFQDRYDEIKKPTAQEKANRAVKDVEAHLSK